MLGKIDHNSWLLVKLFIMQLHLARSLSNSCDREFSVDKISYGYNNSGKRFLSICSTIWTKKVTVVLMKFTSLLVDKTLWFYEWVLLENMHMPRNKKENLYIKEGCAYKLYFLCEWRWLPTSHFLLLLFYSKSYSCVGSMIKVWTSNFWEFQTGMLCALLQ